MGTPLSIVLYVPKFANKVGTSTLFQGGGFTVLTNQRGSPPVHKGFCLQIIWKIKKKCYLCIKIEY